MSRVTSTGGSVDFSDLSSNYDKFIESVRRRFESMTDRQLSDGYDDDDFVALYRVYAMHGFPVSGTLLEMLDGYLEGSEGPQDGVRAKVAGMAARLFRLHKVKTPRFLSTAENKGFYLQPHRARTWMKGGFSFYFAGCLWESLLGAEEDEGKDTDHCVTLLAISVDGKEK